MGDREILSPRYSHEEIEEWRKRESPDAKLLDDIRLYVAGQQNQMLSVEQKAIRAAGRTSRDTADNVLRLVISTAASRLQLEGWAVDHKETQDYLNRLWLTARMDRLQYDTHFAALRDGNTALSMRWRPPLTKGQDGRVTIHREQWWNGATGTFVAYDDYDEPAWAVRDFTEIIGRKERKRRVLYYPDAIYRFIEDGNGWVGYPLPGDPDTGSPGYVPWVRRDGRPLGLPVVHYANSLGDDGLYGRSDVYGLLGIQDDLNSIQHDIAAAAAFTGFQMFWATGIQESVANKVGPGRLISSERPDARFGVFPPGEMTALTEAHEYKRQTIAIDSSTPVHLITGGDWPSGEALLRAEMPQVDKATRLARVVGPSHVLLGHRATEMGVVFGGLQLDEATPLSVEFAAPERLDALTEIAVHQARVALYASLSTISDPELLAKTELLDEAEIASIMAGRAERAAAFTQVEAEF